MFQPTDTSMRDAAPGTDALLTRLEGLAARLEAVELQNEELRAALLSSSTIPGGPADDEPTAKDHSSMSRRGLLHKSAAVVVGGVALAAGSSMLSPKPARAGGAVMMGEGNLAGAAHTSISSSSANSTLQGNNLGSGSGLYGSSNTGEGIEAFSINGTGAFAVSNGDGQPSVHGKKVLDVTGPSVKGENTNATNGYAAVYGITNGTGPAVFGEGLAAGNGTSGVAHGTGSGVYGQSDNGRGGRFAGKKAQLKLDPATAATHPASGDAGDIFLDKSKRLWLCKGGTTWVRIV